MTETNCDSVCMAAMAIADGYQSELPSDHIEAHLANCSGCRLEVEQLRTLSGFLDSQERRLRTESVWKRVKERLPDASPARATSRARHPFVALGVVLLGYRIVEMVPDRDFGFLFKLVPILFVIAAFSYLKENPFKIATNLRLEGE